jgi:hypothetical protein
LPEEYSGAPPSHTHDGSDINSGTIAEGRIHSDIARDSEVATAKAEASKMQNLALGITPTVSAFTTDPSDLDNITDGDRNSQTGTGTKQQAGGTEGTGAVITIDLGEECFVHRTRVKLRVYHSSSTNANARTRAGLNGDTSDELVQEVLNTMDQTDDEDHFLSSPRVRYIKIRVWDNSAGLTTTSVEVFEVEVWGLQYE